MNVLKGNENSANSSMNFHFALTVLQQKELQGADSLLLIEKIAHRERITTVIVIMILAREDNQREDQPQ